MKPLFLLLQLHKLAITLCKYSLCPQSMNVFFLIVLMHNFPFTARMTTKDTLIGQINDLFSLSHTTFRWNGYHQSSMETGHNTPSNKIGENTCICEHLGKSPAHQGITYPNIPCTKYHERGVSLTCQSVHATAANLIASHFSQIVLHIMVSWLVQLMVKFTPYSQAWLKQKSVKY